MDKQFILAEIQRTAAENGGSPLGRERFEKLTGIKQSAWSGRYWRGWSDAVEEAGFKANALNKAYDKDLLVLHLIKLTRKLGRFPAKVDLRLAKNEDSDFPSHNTFENLGSRAERDAIVYKYALSHPEYNDLIKLLPKSSDIENIQEEVEGGSSRCKEGFVYLVMLKIDSKRRYKIGKTTLVERRSNELSIQLPEKLELIHYIQTDDAYGIENYWHKRFVDKNTNGEWFLLSNEDIKAFKKRKFM